MTDRALEHLRVVELSDRIAGSYCAKFLADFGADVVKVERPVGGDPARRAGPYTDDRFDVDGGGLYLFLNTNKKSVTLNAAGATLGALYGRENGGAQSVDLSVLESLMTVLPSTPLGYSYSGVVNSRQGNRFPITIVPCKDGYIGFYTMLQHQWEFLTVLLEMPELQDDERFATPMARFQHAGEAMELLTPWFRDRLADDIVERGQELRIPIVKVANAEDVVNNPQFKARGFLTDLGNAASGAVTGPGRPFNLEGTPWRLDSPAPSLGQHNQLVYCNRLGFSKGELVILSEQGVM